MTEAERPVCRFGCSLPVMAEVSLTDGCVAFPDDRKQFLCAHHLERLAENGCLGEYKVIRLFEGDGDDRPR